MLSDIEAGDGAPEAARGRFRSDVQGMRAIAVLVVVAFHTGAALPGGFVGVDVFFVISGFVIVGSLDREHGRTGTIRATSFYLRRIRRLLPGLALLMGTVAIAMPWLGVRNDEVTARMVTGGALFGANVQLLRLAQGYFDPAADANPLLHLWTLSLEEQVYFVVPAAVLGIGAVARWRSWPWRRSVAIALSLGAVASFASALVLAGGITERFGRSAAEAAFYLPPTRVWEFLVGAVLALVVHRVAVLGARARQVAGASGAILLCWAAVTFDAGTAFPQLAALVPVVAGVLLIVAGTGSGSAVSRALSTPPARWIGDRSYSWYLWHWPVIVASRATFPGTSWAPVAAGALSILPAMAAYRFVEDPIRRHRPVRTRPTVALGAACIVVPIVLAQTIVPVADRLNRDPSLVELGEASQPHLDQTHLCNESLDDWEGPDGCTWPVSSGTSRGRALLIGDSNAGHLSEGFVAAAHEEGLDATIQTRAACPIADLFIRRDGFVVDRCRAFVERQIAWVLAERPKVVVIAHAGDLLMDNPEVELSRGRSGPFRSDGSAQSEIWTEGVADVLSRLADAGVPTVLVAPVPRFTGWPGLGGCSRLRARIDTAGCGAARRPRERVVDRAEAAALVEVPATVGLDLTTTLCPDGTCRTRRAGTWLWKDESHLSVDGSLLVAEPLRSAMAEAIDR